MRWTPFKAGRVAGLHNEGLFSEYSFKLKGRRFYDYMSGYIKGKEIFKKKSLSQVNKVSGS